MPFTKKTRDEVVEDLLVLDSTVKGNPATEGLVRYISGDLVAYVSGQVKSLTAQAMPPSTAIGEVLYSTDGVSFTVHTPVTSSSGWLVNNDGTLLVV